MHNDNIDYWQHDHVFAQDRRKPGETRTLIVIAITATMMVVELFAGVKFGSMALLADGLHMASHAFALSISAFAYFYARRNAHNTQFSFGTGKVNALSGFTGAVLLGIFALFMAAESVARFINPVQIIFDQAIFVATLGLVVNGISVLILGVKDHGHEHHEHEHTHDKSHKHHAHHHDHNLKSAYLHVLADTLTSVLAIVALLAAKYLQVIWVDPAMGVIGAILVARWSFSLLGSTAKILLDRQAAATLRDKVTEFIEADNDSRVSDLHIWSIGPEIYSAMISVVAHNPATPNEYKARLPKSLGLVHIAIEIHACCQDEQAS